VSVAKATPYSWPRDALCCLQTGKGSSSGVGFAIPIDTVKGLVSQILQYGRVMRPSLGVVIAPPQALQRLGENGVLVLDVS
jgi:S1-C subfamily serine protease